MSMHPTRNYFAEFKGDNNIFIETGSYRGDGVQLAIDAGYEYIFTTDNDRESINHIDARFYDVNKVLDEYAIPYGEKITRFLGESIEGLRIAFHYFKTPATIWLDAHWQMLEGTEPGENPFPLLDELAVIKKYGRNDSTILIDDMLIMQYDIVGYSKKEIEAALLDINPAYKLTYLPNPVINGILIAHL